MVTHVRKKDAVGQRESKTESLIGTEDTVVIARGKGNRELLEMVKVLRSTNFQL